MIWLVALTALAAPAPTAQNFQHPNTLLEVGVGTPALASVHGEAWFSDEISGEAGVGSGLEDGVDPLVADWALRWRPGFACFGCGTQNLATIGLGLGGLVAPASGAWGFSAGADLKGTYVHWFTPTTGLSVSLRGGAGPGWTGTDLSETSLAYYGFGSLGFAF